MISGFQQWFFPSSTIYIIKNGILNKSYLLIFVFVFSCVLKWKVVIVEGNTQWCVCV